MRTPIAKPLALTAAFLLSLASGGPVLAGGGHHGPACGHGGYWRHHDHGHYRYDYGHREPHHHRHHGRDRLLLGLLVGGVVGYAIAQPAPPYRYRRHDSYPAAAAAPRSDDAAYRSRPAATASTCLQEREYQTRVMVGGREVEAYGTACLQPDGSWRRGPAQPVTY